jgi:ATP-binding cassette subfamily B protein
VAAEKAQQDDVAAQHGFVAARVAHFRGRMRMRLEIVRMALSLQPRMIAAALGLQLAAGAAPVAFIVATSVVIGRVPPALRHGLHSPEWTSLRNALIATGCLFVAAELVGPMQYALAGAIAPRIDDELRRRILDASLKPVGIDALERQEALDWLVGLVDGSRGVGFTAGGAVSGLFALISRYLRWALAAALVGYAYSWWAACAVAASALCVRVGVRSGLGRLMVVERAHGPQRQRWWYLQSLMSSPAAGKEVRVFGVLPWLQERFRASALDAVMPVWTARRRIVLRPYAFSIPIALVLSALATIGATRAAAAGDLSLTRLLFVLQAVAVVGTLGEFFFESDFETELGMIGYDELRKFEAAAAERTPATSEPVDAAGLPRASIRFESLRFSYPRSHVPVFDGLDLEIEAGRSLAIVGMNGAGKTTLIKLLARLYEPDAGRILIDGTDVRRLDVEAWRARLAAIFQDFVHYELTVRDNVGLGAPSLLDDAERIVRAIDRAGAADFVASLPAGMDTVLSRTYEGGADLSGGQWQKIALARALIAVEAGSTVLVLDEPTANLDVRAEAAFYDQFLSLTEGLTTILISHRFSTVRRADRIVVLEGGRVVEDGSHAELLELDGRYAEMFRLQATRFDRGEAAA